MPKTVKKLMLEVLEFMVTTKASHKQVTMMLKIVSSSIPKPNMAPNSWHKFSGFIRSQSIPVWTSIFLFTIIISESPDFQYKKKDYLESKITLKWLPKVPN